MLSPDSDFSVLSVCAFSLVAALSPRFFTEFFAGVCLVAVPAFPPVPLGLAGGGLLDFLKECRSAVAGALVGNLVHLGGILPLESSVSGVCVVIFFVFRVGRVTGERGGGVAEGSCLFCFVFRFRFETEDGAPMVCVDFCFFWV